jgi:uncharacterized protein with LGFP repeats
MRAMKKRTSAFVIAIAVVALIAGCHATKQKAGETMTSATSAVSSALAGPTETTGASASPSTAAPSTTQMTGANGTAYTVQGPILTKYESLSDSAKKDLGAPTGNEQRNPDGGIYQQFDGGVIINKTQAYVVWGKIRDKWNDLGGSQGRLGYPTSDEVDTPDGGKKSTFEHGTITWKPGDTEATVTYS